MGQIRATAPNIYENGGREPPPPFLTWTPSPPQQSSTFNYLLIAALVLIAALAIIVSWIIYGRKRILRKVLKVDIEAIHAEAKKVESQDFFKKVQEQLKQQRKENDGTPKG